MKNYNRKLIVSISIIILIMTFTLFGEQISTLLLRNQTTEYVVPVSENKISQNVEKISENKIKKDNIDFEFCMNEKKFTMNKENLLPSDLLTVSLNGGQTIKNTVDILKERGHSVENCMNLIYTNWNELLNSFLSEYEIEPVDSKIKFEPDKQVIFDYTQSCSGKKVDREKLYNKLYSMLDNKKISLDLSLENCQPTNTENSNKSLTKEMSHFITDLTNSKKNRHHNVTTALKKINGTIIQPNEIVSFNKLTAPHDFSGGYTNATIISNGEYVDGLGGGICQASTTLYNAVILAGLKVKEVTRHSIPVGYVKLGLDSMVSSYSDMVFENTSEYPIYIRAFTDKESAYVYIYGRTMEDNEYIVRRNEIIRTIEPPETVTIIDTNKKYYPKVEYDDENFELRSARKGYEVNAYLDYYKDNKLIKTEKIRHEIYPPQEKIIVKGSKNRETKNDANKNENDVHIENSNDNNKNKIDNIEITQTNNENDNEW